MPTVKGKRWIKIEGEHELVRKFRSMDHKLQTATLVKSTRPGAKTILDRARDLAPRDRGVLATKGLQLRVTARRKRYGETSVTNTQPYGAHAILQEFGVESHMIGKKRHPGHKAQPFMRPAFDEKVADAEADVTNRLRIAVLEAAK